MESINVGIYSNSHVWFEETNLQKYIKRFEAKNFNSNIPAVTKK